ncbi:MAG: hypothetical protein AABZ60_11660, partial [Planctomycetota bacterium]
PLLRLGNPLRVENSGLAVKKRNQLQKCSPVCGLRSGQFPFPAFVSTVAGFFFGGILFCGAFVPIFQGTGGFG